MSKIIVVDINKQRLNASKSVCLKRIQPPKIIIKFERGAFRFHLVATKNDYDKLGLKKAAKHRDEYYIKCPICNTWKYSFLKIWYHTLGVHCDVENWVIKNALEEIEKQNLEFQLGDRI